MSDDFYLCLGGPCNGRLVSRLLGDSWEAALWANYGGQVVDTQEQAYGHICGEYRLEFVDGDWAYIWQGAQTPPRVSP